MANRKKGAGGKSSRKKPDKAAGKKPTKKARKKAGKKAAKKPAKRSAKKKAAKKKKAARSPRGAARKSSRKVTKKSAKKAAREIDRKATGKTTGRAGKKTTVRRPRKTARRGAKFFERFRQRLLEERQRIVRRLDELREELAGLDETPRELEEWAQEEKDRDILIRLEERETEELRRIQAALQLVDQREYGICQVCGRPIPVARLEELPTAFRCIRCSV